MLLIIAWLAVAQLTEKASLSGNVFSKCLVMRSFASSEGAAIMMILFCGENICKEKEKRLMKYKPYFFSF
jgi:hypothetical protein